MRVVQLEKGALQQQTLRLYGELLARRAGPAAGRAIDSGGCLVLAAGEGCSASGLPAAVSIAGGAMLAVDPDVAQVKSVLRGGGLDFVVNTLDEALRVLKNEVRKRRPLSVALTAGVEQTLAEMAERGVLPDFEVGLQAAEAASEALLEALAGQGMQRIAVVMKDATALPSATLAAWLAEREWMELRLAVASMGALRTLDTWLMELLPQGENLRRRWLQRIAHYQRPSAEAGRFLWLSRAERAALEAVLPELAGS